MSSGRIFLCAGCGGAVLEYEDAVRLDWASGTPHKCASGPPLWVLDAVAAEALAGNRAAARLLPDAVAAWLAR